MDKGNGTTHVTSGSVFDDIGLEPSEAANLKLRSQLLYIARNIIKIKGMKQMEAAEFYGITRPQVSELVNGKVSRFSLDKLVLMLTRAGYSMEVNLSRAVDPEPPCTQAILKDDRELQIA